MERRHTDPFVIGDGVMTRCVINLYRARLTRRVKYARLLLEITDKYGIDLGILTMQNMFV